MTNKQNRWGHVSKIDRRTTVGSDAWKARHTPKIQHLSAHRKLHIIASHSDLKGLEDASVAQKLKAIKRLESR